MNAGQYQYIEKWKDENDLAGLPPSEDDQHEYKRSATKDDDLGNHISKAASAFWNSGGGLFIAGMNEDTGKIDGGIAAKVGRQTRLEWVDRKIAETHPPGPYLSHWIDTGTSIKYGCGILVIAFGESPFAPHMASDGKHYIRLGRHSDPARYYLVEAIRARKSVQTPVLRALLQRSRRSSNVVELGIVVINDAAALNAQINLEPLPEWLGYHKDSFPLQIPLIDRNHPFRLELYLWGAASETFGKARVVQLIVEYEDALGRKFDYDQNIDISHNIDPMTIGDTDVVAVMKAVLQVSERLQTLNKTVEMWRKQDVEGNNSE